MRTRERKQKRRKNIAYFAIGVFLLLALFTPFYSYLYDFLERPFLSAFSHSENLKHNSRNFFQAFSSKKALVEKNEVLEKKVARLEVDAMRTEYLASLAEKNDLIKKRDGASIPALIIKKNNSNTLTINQGKNKGIEVGDELISFDGTLVGRVLEVFDFSSRVHLFTKEGMKVDLILFPENISLQAQGNGNALVFALHRENEVELGDLVYSQNKPGFIVGVVSAIDFDPRDPMKKIYIAPIHGISNLQEVAVVK